MTPLRTRLADAGAAAASESKAIGPAASTERTDRRRRKCIGADADCVLPKQRFAQARTVPLILVACVTLPSPLVDGRRGVRRIGAQIVFAIHEDACAPGFASLVCVDRSDLRLEADWACPFHSDRRVAAARPYRWRSCRPISGFTPHGTERAAQSRVRRIVTDLLRKNRACSQNLAMSIT